MAEVSKPTCGSFFSTDSTGSYNSVTFLYAHTNVREVANPDLLYLIEEVHRLRGTPKEGMTVQFLRQSLYTFGKWTPFDRREFRIPEYITSKGYLIRRVDTFVSTAIYELCLDLLAMPCKVRGEPIEDHHATALYVFLNKALKEQPQNKKRQPLF